MKSSGHPTKFGTFNISPDRKVIGELYIAGPDSYLLLADKEPFCREETSLACIAGTLYDNTKVTLIQCISINMKRTLIDGDFQSWKLFPHFIICGHSHLRIDDKDIQDITLYIDDATTLIYDFDAFGITINAQSFIEDIVASKKIDRDIAIGENPLIAYFTGNNEIFRINTVLGEISAHHNISGNMGGPDGVKIDNAISVSISPEQPINFRNSTDLVLILLRFFDLVIGRKQILNDFKIRIGGDSVAVEPLRVNWSHGPTRSQESEQPHPGDVLTNPITRSSEFSEVLTKWLTIDADRKDARNRFSTCFALGNRYTIDRLIGAANMFDILPVSASPKDVKLSTELLKATAQCKSIFGGLSQSPERDSILSVLGRLGKSSLKHKVRFRAQYIIDQASERFPDLIRVLDEAVNCRNHYVHGSKSKINFTNNFDLVIFFTTTLEFVFAASELIECGWDINAWCRNGTTMSHPFGAYCVNYKGYLERFNNALNTQAK